MSWIQTFTGRAFDLRHPTPAMVNLPDIAHALGHLCRFTGHTSVPYSVARHSLAVAAIVPAELRLQALLHDAHEAYVGDISTPLKWEVPAFREVNDRVWRVVAAAFGIPEELDPAVKLADRIMLMTERRDLLAPCDSPWAPEFEAIEPHPEPIPIDDCRTFGAVDAWAFQRAVAAELHARRAAADTTPPHTQEATC